MQLLLDAKADVNAQDERGFTPLHLAVGTELCSVESIRLLIGAGSDLEARSEDGSTPLYVAMHNKGMSLDWIGEIIDAGAEIDTRNKDGKTSREYLREKFGVLILKGDNAKSVSPSI